MPVSVGNLVNSINTKILDSNVDPLDVARLVDSVSSIDASFSVQSLGDLPSAADNTGRFIYVIDENDYRYSDGSEWTNDYDTTPSEFQIWSWGSGNSGRLGDGTTVAKCSPVQEITSSTNWCQVSAGGIFTTTIKTTGEIWNWGSGNSGRLGDGTTVDKCSPVQEISSSTNWCQVSLSGAHTSAIKTTGEIWSWGIGSSGQLGNGAATNRCSPVQEIISSTDWCQVGAGNYHTSAVKITGEIWSWGRGFDGILGDGTTVCKCSPVREISSSTNWCQVSTGGCNHTFAVKTTGELWSWGNGCSGILGDGSVVSKCSPVREISSSTNWCQVSAGRLHSSALKTTGEIWSWGFGSCGRLGDGTTVSKCSPVREISSSTNWCQVSGGFYFSSALKTTGEIWSWGCGSSGQLGDGTTVSKCSPVREISSSTNWYQVSAGSCHTSAIKISKGFLEL